jgi:hypothetical protein
VYAIALGGGQGRAKRWGEGEGEKRINEKERNGVDINAETRKVN